MRKRYISAAGTCLVVVAVGFGVTQSRDRPRIGAPVSGLPAPTPRPDTTTPATDDAPVTSMPVAVPVLATADPTPAPMLAIEVPDFGTFHLRSACVVFENQLDAKSYTVTVPAEQGGFLIDNGVGIPGFDRPPGPGCPPEGFLILETRLAPGQPPVGTAMVGVAECPENTDDCPIRLAYKGVYWTPVTDPLAVPPERIDLLSSQVDILGPPALVLEQATLWSTTTDNKIVLLHADDTITLLRRQLPGSPNWSTATPSMIRTKGERDRMVVTREPGEQIVSGR